MSSEVVSFEQAIEPDVSTPAVDRLLEREPEHRVWNLFTDSTQQFFVGRWSSTRGKWRVAYTENEFCHITQGRVRIAARSGRSWIFAAGDSFVIPAGFEGTWEVLEDCEKLYAIFQPAH